ncbi:MAG: aminotransferase class V-fold PLP-dependent enzyme, partial [Propionicimonas sp.]
VDELVEVARSAGVFSHSDAVQAVGHVPVDFATSGLDLLSLSAHKLGGPVGIGALVVRRGVSVVPTGFGGGQESRVRSGTVPVALAVGFAAALRDAVARLDTEALRLTALGDRLIAGVRGIPEVRVNTVGAASPAIVHVTVRGTRADDVLLLLDAGGIDCSTGSACAAGVHQPSEVLLAMGRTAAEAAAGLRFSFGPTTTAADVETLLAVLPSAVERARSAFRD